MNEDKACRYQRLKRRSACASVILIGILLTACLFSGASRALRDVGAAHDGGPAFIVAIYLVLFLLLGEVLTLPLAFHTQFLLDRRFGLSSQSAAAWARDRLKAGSLGLLLGLAGGEIVYLMLRAWPEWWWLSSAVVCMAVMGVLAKTAPVVLLPLFYTITRVERASLRARLVDLSTRAGVPILDVYEWGLGENTRRANAALVGTGATRRILVSDTLLDAYSDDEIEVILAHELAHHVHYDIHKALVAECVLLLAAFYAASVSLNAFWRAAGLRSPADVAGLPLLLLAGGATMLAATPVVNALSRLHEQRADRYALAMTRQPAAFISAMRRLAAQNLADERPSRATLWLFHTHPPLEDRIETARTFEGLQLQPGRCSAGVFRPGPGGTEGPPLQRTSFTAATSPSAGPAFHATHGSIRASAPHREEDCSGQCAEGGGHRAQCRRGLHPPATEPLRVVRGIHRLRPG